MEIVCPGREFFYIILETGKMKKQYSGDLISKTIDLAHVFDTHKKPHLVVGRKTYFEILWSRQLVGTAPVR